MVSPRSRQSIASQAKRLTVRFPELRQNSSVLDVEYLFDVILPGEYGIKTEYADLSRRFPGKNVLGFTDPENKECLIDAALYEDISTSGRRRFRATVGHEAGHCLLHVRDREISSSVSVGGRGFFRAKRKDIPAYRDPEWQAWEYGDELLMPQDQLAAQVKSGKSLFELAEFFDVNPKYVETRMRKLKI